MAKLLSGTLPQIKVGISSFSESKVSLSVVGISSLQAISVGGSTGNSGQYLQSTGIGLTWKTLTNEDLSIVRTSYDYTATSGQTTFNLEYTVGYVDVFVNGVLLAPSEYTATDGSSILLSETLFAGDTVQIVAYNPYAVISSGGAISAGGTTGTSGQYLKSTGVGIEWEDFPTLRSENNYTAAAGQTTFTVTYNVGFVDVYVNGVRLTTNEYTASNGTSIVLNEALFGGESIDILAYNIINSGGSGGERSESDTLNSVTDRGNDTTNNINVGILTAKTGVYADVIRRYSDSSTNTKITLESGRLKLFAGNGVTPKININGGVGISTNLNVVGISTFNQDVNVGSDQSTGIVLTSPNGSKFRLIVDNSGNLSTTAV